MPMASMVRMRVPLWVMPPTVVPVRMGFRELRVWMPSARQVRERMRLRSLVWLRKELPGLPVRMVRRLPMVRRELPGRQVLQEGIRFMSPRPERPVGTAAMAPTGLYPALAEDRAAQLRWVVGLVGPARPGGMGLRGKPVGRAELVRPVPPEQLDLKVEPVRRVSMV